MDNYKKIREMGLLVEAIEKEVMEFKIAEPEDMEFQAAVLFFLIVRSGETRPFMLARRLGYGYNDSPVRNILDNWREQEYWDGKTFTLDITGEPLNDSIEFTLFCMAGAGSIERVKANEIEAEQPPRKLIY
jgi:hypothetical protein